MDKARHVQASNADTLNKKALADWRWKGVGGVTKTGTDPRPDPGLTQKSERLGHAGTRRDYLIDGSTSVSTSNEERLRKVLKIAPA